MFKSISKQDGETVAARSYGGAIWGNLQPGLIECRLNQDLAENLAPFL